MNRIVSIAESLDLFMSPTEFEAVRAHHTKNAAAYDAFWRGWLLLESFHSDVSHPEEKIRAAEKHLQRALDFDRSYGRQGFGFPPRGRAAKIRA